MGSTHTGRLRRILPGSTGEHLLEAAPCPVAVAPLGYRHHPEASVDVVACAYDGTAEARRVLTVAEDLARRHDAALRVVQVVEQSEAVDAVLAVDPHRAGAARRIRERPLDDLDRVVAELGPGLDADRVVVRGDPVGELARASSCADLMVAGSHGFAPLHAVLPGAVSGRLIRAAACPVVVVPRAAGTRHDGDGQTAATVSPL